MNVPGWVVGALDSSSPLYSNSSTPSTVLGLFKFLKAIICVKYHALMFAYMCRVLYSLSPTILAEVMEKCEGGIKGLVVKPEDVSVDLVLSFLGRYLCQL